MSPVAGLRKTAAIPCCPAHAADTLMAGCTSCAAWWAYAEALRTAAHWREKYRAELKKRTALERQER